MPILAKHFLLREMSSAPQAVSVHLFNTETQTAVDSSEQEHGTVH